jgi:hypothetical protein
MGKHVAYVGEKSNMYRLLMRKPEGKVTRKTKTKVSRLY